MSVIVEGMDLPSGCLDCRFFQGASGACIASRYQMIKIDDIHERPKYCPLRPLSTPCGPVTLAEKLVPIDISETKEPCPWCSDTKLDWVIYDKQIESVVNSETINYCFHCGRKFK